MADKPINLKESLKKLNTIVEWFEAQEEIDVEAGLEKVKEGATLVKSCKARLSEIENEFQQIQKDVEKTTGGKGIKGSKPPEGEIKPEEIPF